MNKLMTVVAASVCAVSFSATAFAAADASAESKKNAEAMEEAEAKIFEAGVDIDLFSAYVWRQMVQSNQLVLQPCVWADFTYFEPFWVGFSYWQNWDLSDDRMGARKEFTRRLNETDYNIHAGVTVWENEDKDMNFDLELGHEWFTYHNVNNNIPWNEHPSCRELYLKGRFANPVVDVYGMVCWDYDGTEDLNAHKNGFYYELGLNREFELCDALSLGLDGSTGIRDGEYLGSGGIGSCFVGATLKSYLTWEVTDWMSIVGTIAYTGLLDKELRGNARDAGVDRDLLWGGISAKFAF